MRNIEVRFEPFIGYSSAKDAIHAAVSIDRLSRTIEDEEIRGRQIINVSWSDRSFTFNLDDDRSFHISLVNGDILAQLLEKPHVPMCHNYDDIFNLNFVFGEKSRQSVWNREDIANKYIGMVLTNLWFMPNRVLVYTRNMPILSFSVLEVIPNGNLILYWNEWLD